MGYITLLSDFGYQDASVASAKGILAQVVPGSPVIDITHQTDPFHLQQAAYLLSAAYRNFPAGTCHIILYDIFYGPKPALVLSEKAGQYFLAPDNGILPLALGRQTEGCMLCYELSDNGSMHDWITAAGQVAGQLQTMPPNALGLPMHEVKNAARYLQPKVEPNGLEGHVIHIDRFGNVVTNITEDIFSRTGRNRPFRIGLVRDEVITEISRRYNEVKEGEKLCRFNSAGYLEIAINRGNAAVLLGLRLQREQHLIYNTIKIAFE